MNNEEEVYYNWPGLELLPEPIRPFLKSNKSVAEGYRTVRIFLTYDLSFLSFSATEYETAIRTDASVRHISAQLPQAASVPPVRPTLRLAISSLKIFWSVSAVPFGNQNAKRCL